LLHDPFESFYKTEDLLRELQIDRSLGIYRIIDPGGNIAAEKEPDLPREFLITMYVSMIRTRILDSWLLRLQRMGKVALHAPNIGEEAVGVGSALALERDDWIFPYYRNIGVFIARGVSEEEILDRNIANADDPFKGKEFTILGSKKHRIAPSTVPVGNQIPHAVGFALGATIAGERIAVLTIFGDGATSRGGFHVGLNFAGLHRLPVVFVIQNNQWAISMPALKQTGSATFAIKGVAYNIPGVRVDGNDVLAVYLAAREAVIRARDGRGPTLIEAVTYRMGPHTTADDPTRYRPPEIVKRMEKYDPVERFRRYLIARGYISEKEDIEIQGFWSKTIEDIVRKCISKPQLREEVIFEDVYSRTYWNLEEQIREFRESLEVMKKLGIGVG
jgi:pyruvate dehydrogenase E1 component alpha subunit